MALGSQLSAWTTVGKCNLEGGQKAETQQHSEGSAVIAVGTKDLMAECVST